MSKPLVYAHRGASNACFENTMCAFTEAVKQKADGIELDIQLTADGVPVVVHDEDLYRIAGNRKRISSLHYSELSTIRVGKRFTRTFFGHRIPTLREAVSFCEMNSMALNVELKGTVAEKPAYLRGIIDSVLLLDRVHISSFDAELLKSVKTIEPTIETAFLVKRKTTDWESLDRYDFADGFHFHKRLLKDPFCSKFEMSGKQLRVYGVTGKEPFVKNPPISIDGWITDYPSRFKI